MLAVRDLRGRVPHDRTPAWSSAVNGVSFDVAGGETLAILGESGSGKSVTAQAIMGLIEQPRPGGHRGEMQFRGVDLLGRLEEAARRVPRAADLP